MRRILVTGANGFVGRALLSLRKVDCEYVAASRAPSNFDGVNWRRSPSLSPSSDWREALEGIGSVVHLAGRVHLVNQRDSASYYLENHEGTVKLARDAVAAGVSRLVFMSTAKVLGDESDQSGLSESARPRPADPYAASKLAAEEALVGFADRLRVTILRPPLVYGPGVRANFLALLSAVSRGLPLPLQSIRNRRSLIGVTNLAEAIIACLESPKSVGRIYHVTDGPPVSTPELVEAIAIAFGKPARLFPLPAALLELCAGALGRIETMKRLTRSLELDDSAIRLELGWNPSKNMSAGLHETVNWYKAHHGKED